jgi:hypothetical protein
LPAYLIAEWQEYERLEPFGASRDNWHTSLIATILANANRAPGRQPIKPSEFFYVDPDTRQERKDKHTVALLDALSTKHGR